MRPIIGPVLEDYEENGPTSSPESYTGPVGKDLLEMSLDTPMARRGCDIDDAADAARTLQELHNSHRIGSKRSRPLSVDNPLQENVREMLRHTHSPQAQREAPENMIRCGALDGGRKRVCYETDASAPTLLGIHKMHPAAGGRGGPGMWGGILN